MLCAGALACAGSVQRHDVDIRMPFSPALHVMFEMGLTLSLELSLAIKGRLDWPGAQAILLSVPHC